MVERWNKLTAEGQLALLVGGTAVLGAILLWWRQQQVAACLAIAEAQAGSHRSEAFTTSATNM